MGGGIFTYMVELTNRLAEKHEVYIAYATRPQTPVNYRDYFDERIHLIEVENFVREIDFVKDYRALKEVKNIVKEINPSVVHLHSSKAGAIGRIGINGRQIPLFYTPHGYSFLINNHGVLKRITYWSLEMILGFKKCKTISCSRGEHENTSKITCNSTFIENGVDLVRLNEMVEIPGAKRAEGPLTVYTMGRICGQKNPVLFDEIARRLPSIQFVWIGDGDMREFIISENIRVTGWMNRQAALQEAMKADVFLLNSYWEGLPMSLLESMYMYKPCVVSDVAGNHDVISEGENGYVCKRASEYVDVLKRLERIYTDAGCPDSEKQMLESMVQTGRKDIETIYNVRSMAEKYSNVYEQAMRDSL